jgi:hypothetical protein
MPEDSTPLPEKVSLLYKTLTEQAALLNKESDELVRAVVTLDAALQGLNLGIVCWTPFTEARRIEDPSHVTFDLGYARVKGTWGIAIREKASEPKDTTAAFAKTLAIQRGVAPPDKEQVWLFRDAPRGLRLEAIDALPALLERLVKKTHTAALKMIERNAIARELTAAIQNATAATALSDFEVKSEDRAKGAVATTPKKTDGAR